jgi:hypothetical protein
VRFRWDFKHSREGKNNRNPVFVRGWWVINA